MHFTKLFNGNKELGENANKFFNENANDIIAELKPSIFESLAVIFQSVLNNLFTNIPYDELFL